MLELLLYGVLALSFVSGPSAFLLLWLTGRRTGHRALARLSYAVLGLALILLGNATAVVLREVLHVRDPRVFFLIMNEVFLASALATVNLCRFAHESTGTQIGGLRRMAFIGVSTAAFFAVQALPLFLAPAGEFAVAYGYLVSTIYATLALTYSSALVVARRARLPPLYRRELPPFLLGMTVLGSLSIANDVLDFARLLGGRNFPFSPIFFLAANAAIAAFCIRELAGGTESSKELNAESDSSAAFDGLDLTAREREILPLLLDGLSNDEIGAALHISGHTVKNHVTSIYRRVGVESRIELVSRMRRRGQESTRYRS